MNNYRCFVVIRTHAIFKGILLQIMDIKVGDYFGGFYFQVAPITHLRFRSLLNHG